MQLTVEKSDGTEEVYQHTKVLGTFAMALSQCGAFQPGLAEGLAEAVTIYLKKEYGCGRVSFDEIRSMIEAVLTDTEQTAAAVCLHEYSVNRKIKRSRVEVQEILIRQVLAPEKKDLPYGNFNASVLSSQMWNKSVIVNDLVEMREVQYDRARAVAANVEEKVLGLECRNVSTALVRELVNNELIAMKKAESTLFERGHGPQDVEEKAVAIV